MKHVHVHRKSDWFYEFRPFFILVFGVLGLFNRSIENSLLWHRISLVCGLVLIFTAIKICQWRYEYRKQRLDH